MILYCFVYDLICFLYDFVWFLFGLICCLYDFVLFLYDFIWFLYDCILFYLILYGFHMILHCFPVAILAQASRVPFSRCCSRKMSAASPYQTGGGDAQTSQGSTYKKLSSRSWESANSV